MKNKKTLISITTSAIILGSAFGAIFGTLKAEENKKNVFTAMSIEKQIKEFQNKYSVKTFEEKEKMASTAIEEVGSYAKRLLNEGKIESYLIEDDNIVIENKCGLTMMFSPTVKDTYEGEEKVVLNKTRILPNQMIYSEAKEITEGTPDLPPGIVHDGELIPTVAEELADEFDHVTYDEDDLLQDVPLNKEFMQKLGPNQIVMMLGHGTFVPGYHSTLNTGRQFSWEDYQNDPVYREDVKNGLIVDTPGGEAFTTRYVDKYVGDLTNTFIYFGECESAKDSALANSFLYKGCAAVIANTEAISMRYGNMMQYTTLLNLTKKTQDGTRYQTIDEALKVAKSLYGECDPAAGSAHSVPTLFGNPNYSLDTTLVAPVHKLYYEYTGEEIEFVKPGIGFHVEEGSPEKATDAGIYFVNVVCEEGYKWPDPSLGHQTLELGITIEKKQTLIEDIDVVPEALTKLTTGGQNVELFKKGESEIGTFEYYLEDSDEFYWTEKIPTVNKPGTYKIAWRFVGDHNHKDLGGNDGFQFTIEVKASPSYSTIPAWVIVLLCVIGIGAVITLTILTGKKVKKLAAERNK